MPHAAFRHHTAREGFEVVFIGPQRIEGHTAAVEYETPFAVRYAIELDDAWRTRRAEITGQPGTVVLEADGEGHWLVDGERRPDLDGCLDVDLESSAATNAFPVARGATDAPAAYVRAFGLEVMRLEQAYERRRGANLPLRLRHVRRPHRARLRRRRLRARVPGAGDARALIAHTTFTIGVRGARRVGAHGHPSRSRGARRGLRDRHAGPRAAPADRALHLHRHARRARREHVQRRDRRARRHRPLRIPRGI